MSCMTRLFAGMLVFCFSLAGMAGDEKGPAQAKPIPAEWEGKVTDAEQLPVDTNAWGTLQWICNGKLMPGAEQTVGLSTTLPGKRNPLHFHPNCEEVLYVISGQGIHSYDGKTVDLKAGMTIRIPVGVKHNLTNTGTETLKTLISFSSGDRKTVFLEETPAK
jgi:mannose-6-phosphate isomerase-like protein (cupin superfamily)